MSALHCWLCRVHWPRYLHPVYEPAFARWRLRCTVQPYLHCQPCRPHLHCPVCVQPVQRIGHLHGVRQQLCPVPWSRSSFLHSLCRYASAGGRMRGCLLLLGLLSKWDNLFTMFDWLRDMHQCVALHIMCQRGCGLSAEWRLCGRVFDWVLSPDIPSARMSAARQLHPQSVQAGWCVLLM